MLLFLCRGSFLLALCHPCQGNGTAIKSGRVASREKSRLPSCLTTHTRPAGIPRLPVPAASFGPFLLSQVSLSSVLDVSCLRSSSSPRRRKAGFMVAPGARAASAHIDGLVAVRPAVLTWCRPMSLMSLSRIVLYAPREGKEEKGQGGSGGVSPVVLAISVDCLFLSLCCRVRGDTAARNEEIATGGNVERAYIGICPRETSPVRRSSVSRTFALGSSVQVLGTRGVAEASETCPRNTLPRKWSRRSPFIYDGFGGYGNLRVYKGVLQKHLPDRWLPLLTQVILSTNFYTRLYRLPPTTIIQKPINSQDEDSIHTGPRPRSHCLRPWRAAGLRR